MRTNHTISALLATGALATVAALGCAPSEAGELVTVYKTPTCGCCSKWADHLRANGFQVKTVDLDDLTELKRANDVPSELGSCHTALVGGYVVEGHVPAADVARLLEERPDVSGIAAAGMPIGSPGMEGPRPERYDVVAFGGTQAGVFATHQGVTSPP